MDVIVDLNYSVSNKNLCLELKELFDKGVKVSSCNHFALRNSIMLNNKAAIEFLKHEYFKRGLEQEFNSFIKTTRKEKSEGVQV